MEEKDYSVSEAVRLIGAESHVLRYWEDELRLAIRRNAQGHRVYSRQDIDTLRRVRELRDKGLQLKAIRLLMDSRAGTGCGEEEEDELSRKFRAFAGERGAHGPGAETEDTCPGSKTAAGSGAEDAETMVCEIVPTQGQENELDLFERILRRLIEDVVSRQNEKLETVLAGRIREELEDFYLQYDQLMREAAAAREAEDVRGGRLRRALRKLLGMGS